MINDDPNINTENLEELANFKDIPFKQITARASGFIQYYDEFKLYEYAKDQGVTISCINMIGKHVLVDSPILLVYDHQNIEDKTDLTETLLSFVTIGDEPNIDDDIATGTKKLVEIAVKALSPGINDPTTAVFCVEQLGYLLQKVALQHEAKVYTDKNKKVRLLVHGVEFKQLLFQHFYQIAQYGKNDIMIVDAILGALIMICKDNSSLVKDQVWDFSRYLYEKTNVKSMLTYEKAYIDERFYQLSKASSQIVDIKSLFKDENKEIKTNE
ncbi:MAG: DUF2254 domain-containing protein [Erysipelotrichaceae bacterium]|nr:DUF2254 domain-containing protein [Erysipelotrichaceae bacterium]